ncbi:MAG: phage lysozyme [Microvirga sp.]|jgi:lysozyme|nr:phage lysozyme [Microvirga sp.]
MSSLIALAMKHIRQNEGTKLYVYDDATGLPIVSGTLVVGHPTIGRGRNLAARGISMQEADFLELNDLADAEEAARVYLGEAVWSELNDVRRVAIMDMAHQMGPTGLRGFVQLSDALACGAYDAAAEAVLDSRYARQTPGRAVRNAEMLRTGRVAG